MSPSTLVKSVNYLGKDGILMAPPKIRTSNYDASCIARCSVKDLRLKTIINTHNKVVNRNAGNKLLLY